MFTFLIKTLFLACLIHMVWKHSIKNCRKPEGSCSLHAKHAAVTDYVKLPFVFCPELMQQWSPNSLCASSVVSEFSLQIF